MRVFNRCLLRSSPSPVSRKAFPTSAQDPALPAQGELASG